MHIQRHAYSSSSSVTYLPFGGAQCGGEKDQAGVIVGTCVCMRAYMASAVCSAEGLSRGACAVTDEGGQAGIIVEPVT